jgi:hypothetical protein
MTLASRRSSATRRCRRPGRPRLDLSGWVREDSSPVGAYQDPRDQGHAVRMSCYFENWLGRLIEDINAHTERDMPRRGLMDKGVREVDLPALLHQRAQCTDDSVAVIKSAALARGMQDQVEVSI